MRKTILILAILHSSVTIFSQNICNSIGNDSLALYNNGYIVGPQAAGSFPINTETKWINTNGVDSLFINTMQHRLFDSSKIYDENNNLIWTWGGTTVPSITWYSENHSLSIAGNDSVRIEFYQGYTNFSVGHLQIIGISCTSIQNLCASVISDFTSIGSIGNCCYYVSNDTMSWNNANILCGSSGGSMVAINSQQESDSLNILLGNSPPYGPNAHWIGLIDGNNTWDNGDPLTFTNYDASYNQSSGLYMYLQTNGFWDNSADNGSQVTAGIYALMEICGPIPGCTDSTAINYYPNALIDNGSCTYCNNDTTITSCDSILWNGNWYDTSGIYNTPFSSNNLSMNFNYFNSDYVVLNNHPFSNDNNLFSIIGWINPDSLGIDNIDHNFYLHATGGAFDNKIMIRNDHVVVHLECNGNPYELSYPIVNYGDWMHVAYTANGLNSGCGGSEWECGLRLYINGNVVDSIDLQNDINWSSNWQYEKIGGSGAYHGKLDDIQIWNIPLNSFEIQSNMCSVPTTDSNLIHYWNFNDSVGNTVYDQIGVNHGTNFGGDYVYESPCLIGNNGCDSTAILNLTINPSTTSSVSVTECDDYSWNGTTYTTSGSYTYSTTNSNGCDSTATLNLTINPSTTSSVSVTECDTYSWNGQTYTSSGVYTFATLNSNGCDSTATLNLTINPSTTSSVSVTECDTYSWNGQTYTTSGVYTFSSTNSNGCDSTATLNLTINPSTTSTSSVTSCYTYSWNGTAYTTSGTYTNVSTDSSGCTHTETLNLTINQSDTSYTYITSCDSVLWNGNWYTTSGTYDTTFSIFSNQWQLYYQQDFENIIGSEWNTASIINYNSSTLLGSFGNSITSLNLNSLPLHDSIKVEFDLYIIDTWDGNSLNNSNPDFWNLDIDGVNLINTTFLNDQTAWQWGQEYPDNYNPNNLNNYPYWTSAYITNIPSFCWGTPAGGGTSGMESSIYQITKTINHSISLVNIDFSANGLESLCDESWAIDNVNISFRNNSNGCDSTVILYLTINSPTTSLSTISSCVPYNWNGVTYLSSGVYTYNTTNSNGCDSTATLNLTINPSITSTSTVTSCDDYTWNGTTYTSSGSYTYLTTNSNGCDSTEILNLTIDLSTTSITTDTSCGEYTWNGNNYTTSGTYSYSTINSNGCDSTEILNLTIIPTITYTMNDTSCTAYTWNGNTYSSSGTYTHVTTISTGCDSISVLNLIITPPYTNTDSVIICKGEFVQVGNSIYYSPGTYIDTFTTANGCDSILTTVIQMYAQPSSASIQGSTQVFQGSTESYVPFPTNATSIYIWGSTLNSINYTSPSGDSIAINYTIPGYEKIYFIETTSDGCIGDTVWLQIVVESYSGITQTQIDDLNIYPNPSRDIFNIEFSSLVIQDLQIRIINSVGDIVFIDNLENYIGEYKKQISLKEYSKAIYFLEILTEKGIVNKRLILH